MQCEWNSRSAPRSPLQPQELSRAHQVSVRSPPSPLFQAFSPSLTSSLLPFLQHTSCLHLWRSSFRVCTAGSSAYADLGSLERPLLVLQMYHSLLPHFLPFYGTSHYLLLVPLFPGRCALSRGSPWSPGCLDHLKYVPGMLGMEQATGMTELEQNEETMGQRVVHSTPSPLQVFY